MLTNSPRKLWALIGAGGTVAILALSWVLLISGQKSERADLEVQASDAQGQAAVARQKLAAQRKDNEKLPAYQGELAELQRALPQGDASAAFTADIDRLTKRAHVKLVSQGTPRSVSTAPAAAAPAPAQPGESSASASPTPGATGAPAQTLPQIPLTLSLAGTNANLDTFLDLLQREESRAMRITSVDYGGTGGKATLTLAATIFSAAS